ncbi:hypothetical protein C8N47_11174 [Mangrovibacterium marinum]|uniref:Uncharacterized protein n=1 Tax=Mangrovibacterium marinum TaxID=1639118 RepID=A0A2T5C0A9_9BACT|nr:hypothetical protein [Mangrovibacterium marinum]PTN08034.1 hypothetical protein C8N47_11174 [Mangrovibacterium marinum]
MEVRTEQRNEQPLQVEQIGLGKWHVRWNIKQVEASESESDNSAKHYEYNEVTLDHEPTAEEVAEIIELQAL